MDETRDIRVGDWIRFQKDQRLMIGVVSYINRTAGYERRPAAITTEHGSIWFCDVLEVRRSNSASPQEPKP